MTRITSKMKEFQEDPICPPKRFEGRPAMNMLSTETGGRLVEQM